MTTQEYIDAINNASDEDALKLWQQLATSDQVTVMEVTRACTDRLTGIMQRMIGGHKPGTHRQ